MSYTDEDISAFIDHELSKDDTEKFIAAMSKDSDLSAKVQNIKALNSALQSAYRPISDEPIPSKVLELLSTSSDNELIDSDDVADNVIYTTPNYFKKLKSPIAMSMAASIFALVIGINIGSNNSDDVVSRTMQTALITPITQGDELYNLLENTPSLKTINIDDASNITAEAILTFQSENGEYCREFTVQDSTTAQRSVACRQLDGWRLVASTVAPVAESNEGYSTASVNTSTAFDKLVDTLISDIPLDKDNENYLLHNRWKKN